MSNPISLDTTGILSALLALRSQLTGPSLQAEVLDQTIYNIINGVPASSGPSRPLVNKVDTDSDGVFHTGDTFSVAVTFDSTMFVDTTNGAPRLLLGTGGANAYATYVSGSGTDTLHFTYTVQADDSTSDLNYASASALEANGAAITNSLGTAANLTLPAFGSAGTLAFQSNVAIGDGMTITTPHIASPFDNIPNADLVAKMLADVKATMPNTSGSLFFADAGAQTLASAAGDVVVASGLNAQAFAGAGNDFMTGASGNTLLHGGAGSDSAYFAGNAADYTVSQDRGLTLVTSKADPSQVTQLVNVEHLVFSDATVDVTTPDSVSWISALYSQVLGRQADLGGIQFYVGQVERGMSAGDIAVAFLTSPEAVANGTGVASVSDVSVEMLYRVLLGREADPAGLAYHEQNLANGVSIGQVANHFLASPELMGVHGASDLNFYVNGTAPGVLEGTGGADNLVAGVLDDTITGNGGSDHIDGRTGTDTAVFSGASTDYQVSTDGVHFFVRSVANPAEVTTLINVEHVQFSDTGVELVPDANVAWLGALYQQVLGRQADAAGLLGQLDVVENGTSLGQVALSFLTSAEAVDNGTGVAAADLSVNAVFEGLLGRAATTAEVSQYAGADYAAVADDIMHSSEMQAHFMTPAQYDFVG
ncbi:DUF4214 domain-containing protein [Aquabacter sp. L1I39]|uniref:DUF4214 domain-containing protein n=1 Tax=Aquabacter sp. L1I39 TaxID=2820278 RepID=UPI001ADA0E1A|nr:DUF4214 domain-containing protein [Aquabacter sp. L1I39]QTL04312.1 DUF4214 domain-containing protein [Aquabacter sp. L1I39]